LFFIFEAECRKPARPAGMLDILLDIRGIDALIVGSVIPGPDAEIESVVTGQGCGRPQAEHTDRRNACH